MTLVGSLVFGLVQLLLATHDGPRSIGATTTGSPRARPALMCSGVGVSMVIAVGVAVLIAARLAARARCTRFRSAALYLVWFAAIGHVGLHRLPRRHSARSLSFVRTFVAATFGAMGHVRGVGVAARRAARRRPGRRVAAARLAPSSAAGPRCRSALLVGALALLLITGLRPRRPRARFQEKSRYLHLVAAMIAARARRRGRRGHAALARVHRRSS